MQQKKSIVYINQNAGYLMIDIIHANHHYENKSIITGRLVERQNKLDKSVKIDAIIAYDRSSKFRRLFTWGWGFVQIWWKVITKYRNADLFIVTNPPFNTFLPLFCRNKFSVLVFDVYPDALVSYNFLKKGSFITKWWQKTNKKIFKKAARIFTLSAGMKTLLAQYADESRVEVVPLWTDNNFIKPVAKNENTFLQQHGLTGKFVVMYSGNLGRTHSMEALVEVAEKINNSAIHFVIIGEGEKKQLLADMVREKNLANVLLLPWQDTAVLPYSLSAADIGVVTIDAVAGNLSVPSKTFNLMSAAIPLLCIAPAGSELAVLAEQYNIGKNFSKDNIAAMTAYIQQLQSDKQYHDTLRENALKASQHFTPENALTFA